MTGDNHDDLGYRAILTGERLLKKYTGGVEPLSRDEIARLAHESTKRADGGMVEM